MSNDNTVLRTLFVDPQIHERLRHEAMVANVSEDEIIRRYVEVGVAVVDGRFPYVAEPISPPVRGIDPTSVSPDPKQVRATVRALRAGAKAAAQSKR